MKVKKEKVVASTPAFDEKKVQKKINANWKKAREYLSMTDESEWENYYLGLQMQNELSNGWNGVRMPEAMLREAFDKLCDTVRNTQALIPSPIQMTVEQKSFTDWKALGLVCNDKGAPYKDMENITRVLRRHPKYKDNIRMDVFRQEIQFRVNDTWIPYDDSVLLGILHDLQNHIGLRNCSKDNAHDAVSHVAMDNQYDEPKEWLTSLMWDGTPRLEEWLMKACGADDDEKGYHRAVGAGWMMGLVRRLTDAGCIWDNILTLYGAQGVGKTSVFRILGGDWYTAYTGDMGNKDFYLSMRGTAIMDLDEGVTANKADASKLKSIATLRKDTYRAPYDKTVKTYPRRFVFSMSTNQVEHLKDDTGNRRFWTVRCKQVNFAWLESNREQLFAEAYHNVANNIPAPELDVDDATRRQAEHVTEDPWAAVITEWVLGNNEYRAGSKDLMLTGAFVFKDILEDNVGRMDKRHEMKISNILRDLGFEKVRRTVEGTRKIGYALTWEKSKELHELNLPPSENIADLFNQKDKPF